MPSTENDHLRPCTTSEHDPLQVEHLAEEVFVTLATCFPSPVWQQVLKQVNRLATTREEWGPEATPRSFTYEMNQDMPFEICESQAGGMLGPKESTGGAMTPPSPTVSKPPRSGTGFEQESATYKQQKPELLAKHEGRFFVVVGHEIEGPFDSFREARFAGYQKFGYGPLFIKQVLAEEPVVQTSHDF